MAKMSPADWKKEGEELRKKIVSAKKNAQNFGLVIGKEGMILEIHKTQSADKLFKLAKNSENGTPKGVQGVMSVNGTTIQFKYDGGEKDLPGGIQTKWKQYITQAKVTGFKTEFVPGAEAEEDKKETPEQAGSNSAGTQSSAAPKEAPTGDEGDGEVDKELQKKLGQDLDKIEKVFDANYEGMDEKDVKELQGALKTIRGAINSGDLTGAQNMMNKLQLLTGVGPDTPAQPGAVKLPKKGGKGEKLSPEEAKKKKKELTKNLADLKPDLQQTLIAADTKEQNELQKLIKSFGKKMKANEVGDAEEDFTQIKGKVDAYLEAQKNLEKATGAAAAEEGPKVSPERQAERANEISDLKKKLAETLAALEA